MSEVAFSCRACGSPDVAELLDLGRLPLANAFVTSPDETADQFRERLMLLMCRQCSLIQLREEVPPEQLFRSYLWVTSTSAGAAAHARWLSSRLAERFKTNTTNAPFLVEVASNDGFFLRHYRDAGFEILGVDPSNLALEAHAAGLPSVREFFSEAVARQVAESRGRADVIVARNVLGHVNKPADFARGIAQLLAPTGTFVLEVPYAFMLRADLQYDTVFHEHVSYPTVRAVHNLFAAVGLKITDVSFVDMNGGSMLCELVHDSSPVPANDQAMLDFEALIHLNSAEGWRSFGDAVVKQRADLRTLLTELRNAGKVVVGYGAAAKSMTMLNYCEIGPDLVRAMGDANPRKQGLLCPGVRIPVVSPKDLLALGPDYILIGAWNFRDEIVRQFREYGYAGQFILPLPSPVVINA